MRFDVPSGASFAVRATGLPAEGPVAIAIRTDRIALAESPLPGFGFTGLVATVEYFGPRVKLVVAAPGIDEFTVVVDEDEFLGSPVSVGKAVPLSWADNVAKIDKTIDFLIKAKQDGQFRAFWKSFD